HCAVTVSMHAEVQPSSSKSLPSSQASSGSAMPSPHVDGAPVESTSVVTGPSSTPPVSEMVVGSLDAVVFGKVVPALVCAVVDDTTPVVASSPAVELSSSSGTMGPHPQAITAMPKSRRMGGHPAHSRARRSTPRGSEMIELGAS